ncbi:MAG: class I SAM-dependent methyltransferase [Myxococcota bacterium]|nr:class I SAM-dependent methyltransferase [Myxococcota bacterium]
MSAGNTASTKFDGYAKEYSTMHDASVEASGESAEYFARHKVECLARLGIGPETALLDYGCGIGNLTCQLSPRYADVHGFDPSLESLKIARERAPQAKFTNDPAELPDARFGAAVLAGVLHHVPPAERPALLATVAQKLAPGGRLVVFEHNPYNPLTRRAVAACPFDDDAILLFPREVKRLLAATGLTGIRQDFVVFFPRQLAALRPLEPHLGWLFLGAQTMTTATRS